MKIQKEDQKSFEKLSVKSALDLALIIPKSYEDHYLSTKLKAGEFHTLKATIKSSSYHPKYLKLTLFAHNLNRELSGIIFHPRKYHYEKFQVGTKHFLYGKIEYLYEKYQITQPQILQEINKITPKYKSRLQNKTILSLMKKYLKKESLLEEGLDEKKWQILEQIHFPNREFVKSFKESGGFSKEILLFIKYLEVFNYLKELSKKRVEFEAVKSFDNDISDFLNSLPFKLTNDQLKAIEDIRSDLRSKKATRRVIMGDVGSGKTMVIFASVMLVRGDRSILMAPTTILAKQIFSEAKKYLPSDLKITLITNRSSKDEDLSKFDFIIGTHALLYRNLPQASLIMVDEQHRFGTKQRAMIEKMVSQEKKRPHYLQFSATPIPRTFSMMQSALIDISLIKETPFKKDIDTKIVTKDDFSKLLEHIKSEIVDNKQVIIVYPLVEESETIDYQSIDEARGYWERNFKKVFVTYGKDREKDEILERFKEEGDILIATTLIEVGISLPRLSTIILVAPERLGLATLHQLRGRVSRNGLKGYCYLFTKQKKNKRLKEFCKTSNGFEIAELDLRFRQSGDLLNGEIQSGKHFKWFDPIYDLKILEYAKSNLELYLQKNKN